MAPTVRTHLPHLDRSSRLDLTLVAAATVAIRIPALVARAHLTFDDGVYGASAVAMRAGGQPFRDVFSSQGPLFLPLIYVADAVGLRSVDAPRLVSVAAALILVVATYVAGRSITDRGGAVLAAAVVSGTSTILWVTGPIAADGAALAAATLTVALAVCWRDNVTTSRAIWLGLGVGATISVKALLAPVVVPVALVLLARRRVRPVVAGTISATVLHLALWLPWGPGNVWEQSYRYHLTVASSRTPGANLAKVLSTLGDRDAVVLAGVVCLVGALALRRRSFSPPAEPRLTSPDTLLLAWLAATAVVLLAESPLWRPHVSQLIPGLVLLAARHRPPARALLAVAVVVLPYQVVHAWPILDPSPYDAVSAQTIRILQDLPPGARAMSDDPGIVWRAGRLTPPDLVDASILRIQTGDLTAASLAAAAAEPAVCAVVVRSTVRWGSFADLPDRLSVLGYVVVIEDGPGQRVFVRSPCHPGGS